MQFPRPRRLTVRWQATLIALALVLGFGGGAVAKAKYDAQNAHKVDGKHAVSSGASLKSRKGKLVATSPKTGRLPDNIIGTAPDAAKLGGYTHAKLASLPVVIQGVYTSGGTSSLEHGKSLSADGDSTISFSFMVPADHKPGSRLAVELVWKETASLGGCRWVVTADGASGPVDEAGEPGDTTAAWLPPGGLGFHDPINMPFGDGTIYRTSFAWQGASDPGMFVQFRLKRSGSLTQDDCGIVTIVGAQVRY